VTRKTDLTGQRFGRVLVLSEARSANGKLRWFCRCDCGNEVMLRPQHLADGKTKSCGCYRRSANGHAHTPTHTVWSGMIARCTRPNNRSFKHYGSRGITVCGRWLIYENFLADMGERPPGKSLDRINNSGNYEPENCQWATKNEQQRNKGNNRVLVVGGARMTLAEASERFGVKVGTIWARLESGWSDERAALVPLRGTVAA
jgi:hypothetical protein